MHALDGATAQRVSPPLAIHHVDRITEVQESNHEVAGGFVHLKTTGEKVRLDVNEIPK